MGMKARPSDPVSESALQIVTMWDGHDYDNLKDAILDARSALQDFGSRRAKAKTDLRRVLVEATTQAQTLSDEDPSMAEYLDGLIDPTYLKAPAKKKTATKKKAAPKKKATAKKKKKAKARTMGFIDVDGNEVVGERYEAVRPFSDGLAWVKVDGKWGAIDRHNAMVIEPRFVWTEGFSDGLAPVRESKRGRVGYIDKNGEWVIQPQFDHAFAFVDGYGVVSNGGEFPDWAKSFARLPEGGVWGALDSRGRFVVPLTNGWVQSGGGRLLVNEKGRHTGWGHVQGGSYKYIDGVTGTDIGLGPFSGATNFGDGLAIVQERQKWTIIDASGREVGTPTRRGVYEPFSDGRAVVSEDGSTRHSTRYSYIDRTGKVVLDELGEARPFNEGVASINIGGEKHQGETKGGRWGFCDVDGNVFCSGDFHNTEYFSDGRGLVWTTGSRVSFVDRSGEFVIRDLKWARPFSDGRAAARF